MNERAKSKGDARGGSMVRLVRAVRRAARAWDVDFWEREGIRSIAVVGTERDVMQWAQARAKARKVKRWVYRPFPEFNDRYRGKFEIANCPSWVLVRPNVNMEAPPRKTPNQEQG